MMSRRVRRRSGEPAIPVGPLIDIPFPTINLSELENPVPAIVAAPEFAETQRYFAEGPSAERSLLPPAAQALLYTIIRNQRPEHVVEIGTYKGGTSETLGRALVGNAHGVLHTVSPYDVERFGSNYRWWPAELKRRVHYYAMNSMGFFVHAEVENLALDLALIDGNHDYEFAAFDIHAAARLLSPGGFIFIDNVSQVGPFLAATEFFAANPDWIDCGLHPLNRTCERAHDRGRTNVPDTDFFIFRSPQFRSVGAKPRTFGNVGWTSAPVSGVRLSLAGSQSAGTLRVQCILRAFSDTRIEELIGETAQTIEGDSAGVEVRLKAPIAAEGEFSRYQVETWLMWSGGNPLKLSAPPEVL